MLFYNGKKDHLSPVNSVEKAYAKMHKVWDSRQAGDRLVTRLWNVGHISNEEMQDEAFRWLEKVLKSGI